MVRYERYILNRLLDGYESSLLFMGKNKVQIRISFPFTRKNVPEYFDESSVAYEEIHGAMRLLEKKQFIEVVWKKENHIMQKVLLNEEKVNAVYQYLKRVPKAEKAGKTLKLLDELKGEAGSETCGKFIDYLRGRIQQGQSVKEYIEPGELEKINQLIMAVYFVEKNQDACYIREFSIKHFGDSKVFEALLPLIGKVMRQFNPQFADIEVRAILAEYLIYHTPDYVYVKGSSGILEFGESQVVLRGLRQGFGICGEDLAKIKISKTEQIKKVITIENLTTFFCWSEEESLQIYLGGYHNEARRQLLWLIHEQLPQAQYLHFGDIDVGGFEIYEDLKRRTGIAFHTYRMDLGTLKEHEQYARQLTVNDKKRIRMILHDKPDIFYGDVLAYMLDQDIKLEQECIGLEE